MYRMLFQAAARVGRPFGGIPPRRVTRWLADQAYRDVPRKSDFAWVKDRDGNELLLHPYYLIDRDIIAFGGYDADVVALLRRQLEPGMVCMDVGANIGAMSLPMGRRVGPSGRVYSFEPHPEVSARLRENVRRNGLDHIVAVQEIALSDKAGEAQLSVTETSASNQGMGSLVSHEDFLSRAFTVRTQTLDEFAAGAGIDRLDFIKLDIQGAEPLFLQGAAATLGRFHPDLLMEVSRDDLRSSGLTPGDLLRRVENLGYTVYLLERDGSVGSRLSSDAVGPDFWASGVYCTARPR